MKPSHRVQLIQKLCHKLEDQDWGHLDLLLRQFGLPWSDTWEGDKSRYCLHHTEKGENGALLELYEHLYGIPFPDGTLEGAKGPWIPGKFRLFLSHVSAHKVFISSVKTFLAGFGVDAFVAHEDIEPTKEWEKEIELALETCDALAAMLTPDFHASRWTDQEVGFCIKRRVLLVPVRMGMDPYGFMGRYQALNGAGKDSSTLAAAIFELLVAHDLTSFRVAPALVTSLGEANSFAEAKRLVGLCKRVTSWTPETLQRLEQTIEANLQVGDAWGVPEQIREIVGTHSR